MPASLFNRSTKSRKKVHSFTVCLSGIDEIHDDLEDSIYGGGIDDALLRSAAGKVLLDFSREAGSMLDAIGSAIRDLESRGLQLAWIKSEDTLFVFKSDEESYNRVVKEIGGAC